MNELVLFLITTPVILYVGTRIMATAFFDAKLQYQLKHFRALQQEYQDDPADQPKA